MKTDWNLVRSMMNAAIDACEALEMAGYDEPHRPLKLSNGQATVYDLVVSAWTLPESMRYQIIRARHDAGTGAPYVQESARILVNMAQAAAELAGAPTPQPVAQPLQHMIEWYDKAMPELRAAIARGSAA
ncbi:hypothetical protein PGB34_02455 [Xenophilus arseniciresistens]|uniref:Uncharacterized protein n=1 Tax=Xenophilus arseniciresistens TaxID=1283306 RepID=A0AAE3N3Q1_9BURK|nr:hypothetical protein [Xenophilus arseniciresistens]MDA7415215.1 hypothetical protein [Xenophilus arseniciresistens]